MPKILKIGSGCQTGVFCKGIVLYLGVSLTNRATPHISYSLRFDFLFSFIGIYDIMSKTPICSISSSSSTTQALNLPSGDLISTYVYLISHLMDFRVIRKGEGLVGLTRGIGPTQFLSKLES